MTILEKCPHRSTVGALNFGSTGGAKKALDVDPDQGLGRFRIRSSELKAATATSTRNDGRPIATEQHNQGPEVSSTPSCR